MKPGAYSRGESRGKPDENWSRSGTGVNSVLQKEGAGSIIAAIEKKGSTEGRGIPRPFARGGRWCDRSKDHKKDSQYDHFPSLKIPQGGVWKGLLKKK